jgi:hypothetical protein
MTDIQNMKEALKQIEASHTPPPQASPSILGGDAIDHLNRNSRFVEFKCDDMEKRSVLTLDQQKSLEGCQTEQQVVAFITQYLEKLVQELEHYVLVNSEYNPWLEVGDDALSKKSKKPDLFIGHEAIVTYCTPAQPNDIQVTSMRRESYKFGKLTHWKLRSYNIGMTIEAKQKIGKSGFGQIINYGRYICCQGYGVGDDTTKLMLFDKKMF